MRKITLISKSTKSLSKKEIILICKLKNSFWRWTISKQILWFKNTAHKNDINILLLINKELAGYTLLRRRKAYQNRKLIKYLYLDSFLVKKKYRGKKLGKKLILFNNKIINRSKKHSFLTCEKKTIPFYREFNWKTLARNKFKIMDHKHRWFSKPSSIRGMTYNLKKKNKDRFFYYFN